MLMSKHVELCLRFLNAFTFNSLNFQHYVEQGWRSSEKTRLPPMWPGFDSRARRHMRAELTFVASLHCSKKFSPGTPVFPSFLKPTFDLICLILRKQTHLLADREDQIRLCDTRIKFRSFQVCFAKFSIGN